MTKTDFIRITIWMSCESFRRAIKLVDYIVHEIDRKLTPVNIYIDLSKAFDTLNFDILLYKLHYYGITNIALKLLKSYISNRKQYV